MPFAIGVSTRPRFEDAVREACEQIAQGLNGAIPDLTAVFLSNAYASHFEELPEQFARKLQSRYLVGATGEAIIGGGREIESGPALSVWCGCLPGTEFIPFSVDFEQTPDGTVSSGLPVLDDIGDDLRAALILGEPFSCAAHSVLDHFNLEAPGVPVVGGMASGGGPGENCLFLGEQWVSHGAVGLLLKGGNPVRTIVSQGCRPVGPTYLITKSDRNIIFELGGKAPLSRLKELYPNLSEDEQKLIEQGVHLGIAMNEYQDHFQRGDFLISSVLGADRQTGALALGNGVRVGQTVQFHLRDAASADDDLLHLLEQQTPEQRQAIHGGLLFSCNGRGTRMFPQPDHDAKRIQESLGEIPIAGIFAQGEFGPVSGRNYIHGFTASLALFE